MRRLVLLGFTLFAAGVGWGQSQEQQSTDEGSKPREVRYFFGGSRPGDMRAAMMLMRNVDRQDRVVADTNKLVALASSLQQETEKGDSAMDAKEAIKRVDEIEKLAKNVKERMKR